LAHDKKSQDYFFQVLTLVMCQIILCVILVKNLTFDPEPLPSTGVTFLDVLIVKFVCALSLHLLVQERQIQGLIMAKHVLNHQYKFDYYLIVFFVSITQTFVSFMCEILCCIQLATTNDILEIIG
jgi:hypothetical protein